jgi:hypothetical protein
MKKNIKPSADSRLGLPSIRYTTKAGTATTAAKAVLMSKRKIIRLSMISVGESGIESSCSLSRA